MDSFASGVLGILTTGRSLLDALRKFADTLDFIQKQVGPATTKSTSAVNETSFTDVIHAIKQLVDKQVRSSTHAPGTYACVCSRFAFASPGWWERSGAGGKPKIFDPGEKVICAHGSRVLPCARGACSAGDRKAVMR